METCYCFVKGVRKTYDVVPDEHFGYFARLRRKNAKIYVAQKLKNGTYHIKGWSKEFILNPCGTLPAGSSSSVPSHRPSQTSSR